MAYTRRQELICTEDQMNAKPNVILRDGEVIRIRMNNGSVYEKIGDGVTPIIDLPYNINSEIAAETQAELERRVAELGVVQTTGHSPTAVMSQDAVTKECERIEGITKMYASDFVSGYLSIGTGLAASGSWIINPEGVPIKKGDKVRINPNGLVVNFMIESVPDLASITKHLFVKTDNTEEFEVVSGYDGYAFFQIRDAAWGAMSPDSYVCDISIGESNVVKTEEKINALEERVGEIERVSVGAKMYPSDFVNGYLQVGTGLAASATTIINPVGVPIKKGDKVRIYPNGCVLSFMIESVSDLASITKHLFVKTNISEVTEIVSDYDGYAFFQIRDSAGGVISPDLYACDISIGEFNMEKINSLEEKCLSLSPKQRPFTRIINDCQTASDWTITNTAPTIEAVDTDSFIFGTQSLHSDNLMRCIKNIYDMVNNDIVVKLKINSIANNAKLYLKVGNTADTSVSASYQLARGSTWTTPNDWYEIAIPYTAFSYGNNTYKLDFRKIDDVSLHSADGAVDWNLQYIGLRPKKLKKGIVTFTFDDGFKSQYTGIKILAEKGITGTIFHIKEATEKNPNITLSIPELQELVNYYGADIEVHGDPSYDQWSEADLVEHWKNSQKWLKENGISNGKYMAYPNGVYPDNVVQLAKGYFDSCRTITQYPIPETYPPADRYRVRALSGVGEYGAPVDAVKRQIDNAMASGAWLVLVFHTIGEGTGTAMDCSVADLKAIADYAINSGAYIMNYAEVFESGII